MAGNRRRAAFGIGCCGVLILLAPALAAGQDPVPAPKQDTVTIRAVDGTFELKGTSSVTFFEFTEQCEARQGYAVSSGLLTLPLDLEAGPNDSLERATKVLREAVAKGSTLSVEPSSEAGQVALFSWGGRPRFEGVVESLSVKYTLFLPDGTPVRATASFRMKQAGGLQSKEEANEANKSAKKKPGCAPAQQ